MPSSAGKAFFNFMSCKIKVKRRPGGPSDAVGARWGCPKQAADPKFLDLGRFRHEPPPAQQREKKKKKE